MSKIKKILILMIIMLGIIFLSNNSVNAIDINLKILKASNNLYCVNHGQPLNSYKLVPVRYVCPGLRNSV